MLVSGECNGTSARARLAQRLDPVTLFYLLHPRRSPSGLSRKQTNKQTEEVNLINFHELCAWKLYYCIQGLRFIMPIIGSLSYTAPSLGLIVQPPGHRSRARPWCRRGRALSCSQRRHTVILSSGVACSAHGEQRGGSVRRLRTRRGDELARSPAMPRPPPSMMPSLRRPCGRPSCSSAAICRLGAAGRPENQ